MHSTTPLGSVKRKAAGEAEEEGHRTQRQPFTPDEDFAIRKGVLKHGTGRWKEIIDDDDPEIAVLARKGRTSDSVRVRFTKSLEPKGSPGSRESVGTCGEQGRADSPDLWPDYCAECFMGGKLLCCDGCPRSFHLQCCGLKKMPGEREDFFCDGCRAHAKGGLEERYFINLHRERQHCQDPAGCSALNFLIQSIECAKAGDSLGDLTVPAQWRLPPRQRQSDGTISIDGGGYARVFLALGFFVDPETRGAEDTWRGIGFETVAFKKAVARVRRSDTLPLLIKLPATKPSGPSKPTSWAATSSSSSPPPPPSVSPSVPVPSAEHSALAAPLAAPLASVLKSGAAVEHDLETQAAEVRRELDGAGRDLHEAEARVEELRQRRGALFERQARLGEMQAALRRLAACARAAAAVVPPSPPGPQLQPQAQQQPPQPQSPQPQLQPPQPLQSPQLPLPARGLECSLWDEREPPQPQPSPAPSDPPLPPTPMPAANARAGGQLPGAAWAVPAATPAPAPPSAPTVAIFHEACLLHGHATGAGCPESASRLAAVIETLRSMHAAEPTHLALVETPPEAAAECLEAVHEPDYLAWLASSAPQPGEPPRALSDAAPHPHVVNSLPGLYTSEDGERRSRRQAGGEYAREKASSPCCEPDGETFLSSDSLLAVRCATGAVCLAVDCVLRGSAANAFCAVRPPGHHAGRAGAALQAGGQGFCLVNHVAVGARYAQREHGVRRVAIVDFDVHHGNGTEEIFAGDEEVLFASIHLQGDEQLPFFPNSKVLTFATAPPNVLNCAVARHAGAAAFRQSFVQEVLPRLQAHRPEMIFVSAGFDAHADDPLGGVTHGGPSLAEDDFGWCTAQLRDLAARVCGGRLVSVLEGGYSPPVLQRCVRAHVEALMHRQD